VKDNNRKRRGSAIIEFAVAATVLLPCLFGCFQFGYTLYRYNLLCSSVADGARYAAYRTYRSATSSSITNGQTAIKNMVVYGSTTPGENAVPVVPGLSRANVGVTYVLRSTGLPESVEVSISSYTLDAVVKSFTLTGKPAVSYPYMGRYAPEETE
jgi:Flp pilus assembly protein TadG